MPAPTAADFETEEYARSAFLGRINASHAYARGATGEGQKLLVVDSGLLTTHLEFSGEDKATTAPLFEGDTSPDAAVTLTVTLNHGTAVSGIAVANRGGTALTMHGVAFDASIHLASIPLGSGGDRPYTRTNINGWDSPYAPWHRRALTVAAEQEASVINYSWGVLGAISTYDATLVQSAFSDTAAVLAQARTDKADRKIFVWAAGNSGNDFYQDGTPAEADSPEIFQGLGVHFPELRGHVLAVVALNTSGGIATYSNRCGIAKDFCLAAPGNIAAPPWGDGEYRRGGGTSFAAPVVSGSLLVLRQHFRGMLGNTAIVSRLLTTAFRGEIRDTDGTVIADYSDSDTYGRGLVDLDAASRPFESERVLIADTVDGASLPLAGTRLRLAGGAAGDALRRALGGREFAFVDKLDAPFFLPAAGMIDDRSASARPYDLFRLAALREDSREASALGWTLSAGIAPHRGSEDPVRLTRATLRRAAEDGGEAFFSLREHPGRLFGPFADDGPRMRFDRHHRLAAPWMGFAAGGVGAGGAAKLPAGGRLAFGVFRGAPMFPGDRVPEGESNLAALIEARSASGAYSLQAGFLRESESALGIDPEGAMGSAEGRTFFAGASVTRELGPDWTAAAAAFVGRTGPGVGGRGVVREIGALTSSSFGLALRGAGVLAPSDEFDLSLSQPLRIESGSARIDLPAGRTRYGEALRKTLDASLEPSGREIDLRASYSRSFGPVGLRAAAGWVEQRGHVRARDGEPYGLLELRRTF